MVAILITIACNAAKAWGQNTDETLYSVTADDNIVIIQISELMDGTHYEAGETVKFTISLDGLEPSKRRLATVKDADGNVISTEYQYNATDKTESYSFTMPAKREQMVQRAPGDKHIGGQQKEKPPCRAQENINTNQQVHVNVRLMKIFQKESSISR